MIIDRIKFTKEFLYHGVREWIGMEATITPDEDEILCLLELRQKTTETFNSAIGKTAIEMQPPEPTELPVIQVEKTTKGFNGYKEQINSSDTIEELKTHHTIASLNPKLMDVYNNKMEEIKQKTVT